MAIYEPGAGLDPFRGLDLGTVFQRGKYAPVIKSGSKTQGQRLAPFQDQKAAWYRALQLWKELLPFEKANWDAARPDFPTTDRFGNTVLSSARDLFLRTIARLPIEDQKPLNTPRAAYTGTTPADPDLQLNSGALEFTVPAVPAGEQFGYSLFMTIQRPLSTAYPKTSYRRIAFDDDYSTGATIDVTAQYEALFGSLQTEVRIFWCAEIVNTDTPEVLSSACGSVITPASFSFYVRGNGVLSDTSGQGMDSPTGTGIPYDPVKASSISILARIDGPGNGNNEGAIYSSVQQIAANNRGYYIKYTANRGWTFQASGFNNFGGRVTPGGQFNYGDFVNVQFVKRAGSGALSNFEIWVNGVRIDTANIGSVRPANSAPVSGARVSYFAANSVFGRTVRGIVYDVLHCDNYEFTAQDLSDLAAGILPAIPITSRWRFEENQGTLAPSVSGTKNLTLNANYVNTAYGAGTWRNASGGIAT